MKRHHHTRGFTLIELMIVVAIVGVLASIALPEYGRMTCKAKQREALVVLDAMMDVQTAHYAEHDAFVPFALSQETSLGGMLVGDTGLVGLPLRGRTQRYSYTMMSSASFGGPLITTLLPLPPEVTFSAVVSDPASPLHGDELEAILSSDGRRQVLRIRDVCR